MLYFSKLFESSLNENLLKYLEKFSFYNLLEFFKRLSKDFKRKMFGLYYFWDIIMSYSLNTHKNIAIDNLKKDIYDAIDNDYYNDQILCYLNINNFDSSKVKIISIKSVLGNAVKMIYEINNIHFIKILYETCTYFICKETKYTKISNNPFYTKEGYSFNIIQKIIDL